MKLFTLILVFSLSLVLNCSAEKELAKKASLEVEGPAFRLSNGSPLSHPYADEYNPLLLPDNNRLILLYASNQKLAECHLCLRDKHNLFVTWTKDTTYQKLGQLPAFERPKVLTLNGTPLNSHNRLTFSGYLERNTLILYLNNPFGQDTRPGYWSVPLEQLPNATTSWEPSDHPASENLQIIGLTSENLPLGRELINEEVYMFSPTSFPGTLQEISELKGASSASYLASHHTGFPHSYFFLKNHSLHLARQNLVYGSHPYLMASLRHKGLTLSTISTYQEKNQGERDLLVFSAHDGISENLYAVTSHNLKALWEMALP